MEYEVYNMNSLDETCTPIAIDGFVFFANNEERSWNVVSYMIQNKKLPKEVFSLHLDEDSPETRFNDEKYSHVKFERFEVGTNLAENFIPCLKNIHTYVENKSVIGIDISVMPTPIFAQILHFLFEKHRNKKIVIYYTEPRHYNLDNLFDFNSYDGEIDIRAISGYEGITAQKKDSHRIIFYLMGFEMNDLNKIITQQINSDGIIPINGFPSYFPKYKDISLINNNVNYHEKDIQVIFSEASNPFDIYNQMNILKNKYSDYCIDIVPAGTKPMALGACLFALKNGNNNTRILFPFPREYKNQKSIGQGVIWEYAI